MRLPLPVAIKFSIWPSVENICPPLVQIIVIYLAVAPNKAHYCAFCHNMGVGKIFSRVGQLWNFFRGSQKDFSGRGKVVKIRFGGEISYSKLKYEPFLLKF